MGTNYYVKAPPAQCPHCGEALPTKVQHLHIGKCSGGWEFLFHAARLEEGQRPISSYIEWKAYLASLCLDDDGIIDEYGQSLSLEMLLKIINQSRDIMTNAYREGNQSKVPASHWDYCALNHPSGITSGEVFKDSHGWSFCKGTFS